MNAVDIFIAESDPNEAGRIEQALRPILNRVVISTDAERAIDYLFRRGVYADERRTPDLILIDSALVGDDCWPIIREMRSDDRFNGSLIAVLGDDPSIEKAEQAREAGVTWYVGKPLSIDALTRIVEDIEEMGLAIVHNSSIHPALRRGVDRLETEGGDE